MDAKAPKGNRYDKAFVAQALELLKCSGRPRSHIAKELGVSQTSLERWEMQANLTQGTPVPPTTPEEENRRLRQENAYLRQQAEILKKAIAYFSPDRGRP